MSPIAYGNFEKEWHSDCLRDLYDEWKDVLNWMWRLDASHLQLYMDNDVDHDLQLSLETGWWIMMSSIIYEDLMYDTSNCL